jgi:mRNA-degrading endonuclease toxin of MazEF toxin-antitoxin module
VIVSNDGFNVVPTWRSIIVVPITTSSVQRQRAPTVVPLSSVGIGLKDNSAAVCHQITTIDRSKLDSRIGSLHPPDIRSIEHGIIAACDLPM